MIHGSAPAIVPMSSSPNRFSTEIGSSASPVPVLTISTWAGRLAATDARDVYEEGIIIPVSKLVRKGEPNDELFRLLRRNVRAADKVIGDLRAQIAANHAGVVGVRRLLDAFRARHAG